MKATKEASIYEGDAVLFPKPDAAWLERPPDKLDSHRHPDRSICRRGGKAGRHLDGREPCQRGDDAVAVFWKCSSNGQNQTFLMGIHQRIQLIFCHQVGHFNPDLVHLHPATFIVRRIGAVFVSLCDREELFQRRFVVLTGSEFPRANARERANPALVSSD